MHLRSTACGAEVLCYNGTERVPKSNHHSWLIALRSKHLHKKRPVKNHLHRSVSFARRKLSLLRLRDETLILSSLYAVSSNLSAVNYCRIYRVNLSAVE